MEWDLGIQGLGVLAIMSLAFGVIGQLIFWNHGTRWTWLVATLAFFVAGLFVSEVWFGWATEAELQPNIDGLSFDEVLLIGYGLGIPVLVIWRVLTGRLAHRPTTAH
jgi:hypothetical protein